MRTLFFFCFVVLATGSVAQAPFRVEADFSLKQIDFDGTPRLLMGRVFYDHAIGQVIFRYHWPDSATVVMDREVMHLVGNDSGVVAITPQLVEQSYFALSLSGDLPTYGLHRHGMEPVEQHRDSGNVVSIWKPKDEVRRQSGDRAALQTRNNQLLAAVFYRNDTVTHKVNVEAYQTTRGIHFPTAVTQAVYLGDRAAILEWSFRDLVFDRVEHDDDYRIELPEKPAVKRATIKPIK